MDAAGHGALKVRPTSHAPKGRPKVLILRGTAVNPWELRAWRSLEDRYDVSVLVPEGNGFESDEVGVRGVPVTTALDLLPDRVGRWAANRIDRYRGLAALVEDADIVHAAELNTWFSAQAAGLRPGRDFRLALTVWETLPFRAAYRSGIGRRRAAATAPHVDLFLPTTERAALALELEGVPRERMAVSPPGIDTERFGVARTRPPSAGGEHVVLSVARLVWEKGLQDVLRALALVHRAGRRDVVLEIVGTGPDRERLADYAGELGLGEHVRFSGALPYDELPQAYARASALVLASLPVPSWDEQFGMVLAEGMAGGLPIVATRCGAIEEVLGGERDGVGLVAPGDWPALADALLSGPLREGASRRVVHDPAVVDRYSQAAAAERLAAAYDRVLGG